MTDGSGYLPKPCLRCGHSEDAHGGDKDCMCGKCMWFVEPKRDED